MGQRLPHGLRIRCAMDVNEPSHGINSAPAVIPGFLATEPENPREYPVTPGMRLMELRAPDLSGGTPAAEDRAPGLAGADAGANAMPPQRRSTGTILLTGPGSGRGNAVAEPWTSAPAQSHDLTGQVQLDPLNRISAVRHRCRNSLCCHGQQYAPASPRQGRERAGPQSPRWVSQRPVCSRGFQ